MEPRSGAKPVRADRLSNRIPLDRIEVSVCRIPPDFTESDGTFDGILKPDLSRNGQALAVDIQLRS